ncbi:MAG: tRNA lysidine(34) synthetase TilS [Planctomycetes bacterium]|nr:tRNA lysidine(34) synthetase TilS [Planctomycetota bacterium]
MTLEFEKKVLSFIKSEELFGLDEKVLLAVSGGADSTALLHVMCRLKMKGVFNGELLAVHFNHQLRGVESDGDERFVVELGGKLGVEVVVRSFDVRRFSEENKLSIETAGRQLRIAGLLDIAKGNDCKVIATAHHGGDNAETVVHRFVRGTGIRGLGGIWPVREAVDGIRFVRPILEVSRSEIIEYLNEQGLGWREDRTNKDYSYKRNFIRHKLLPQMQKESDTPLEKQLLELSRSARGFYSLVCRCVEDIWGRAADCQSDRVKLKFELVANQHPAVQVELIRRSLEFLKCGERDITQEHYEMVLALAKKGKSGKKIELPGGFVAEYAYGELVFSKGGQPKSVKCESVTIEVPGRTGFGECLIEASILDGKESDIEKFKSQKTNFVEWFDLAKLKLPLEVRGREDGDRFVPFGFEAEKKVGKFLTAQRVGQELRRKTVVVCDSEKIIWVCPVRVSELTKVGQGTEKVLELRFLGRKSEV